MNFLPLETRGETMSTEEIKTKMLNTFMDAFNNGDLAALDTICAPNMVDHSTAAASGQPNDLEGFKSASTIIAWESPTCASRSRT
jgi:hypothetical protein